MAGFLSWGLCSNGRKTAIDFTIISNTNIFAYPPKRIRIYLVKFRLCDWNFCTNTTQTPGYDGVNKWFSNPGGFGR